jgi:hypothetical protein
MPANFTDPFTSRQQLLHRFPLIPALTGGDFTPVEYTPVIFRGVYLTVVENTVDCQKGGRVLDS